MMKTLLRSILEKAGLFPLIAKLRWWLLMADIRALLANARLRAAPPDGLPIPPAYLMVTVAGNPDGRWFLEGGRLAAKSVQETMKRHGIEMEKLPAILDFGCGCGRVIRHWVSLKNTEVHGSDLNPKLIEWCRENLSFAHFQPNQAAPPLAYAENKFDLVYAFSVFTHLPEDMQFQWISEMSRILKPSGHLLISTHGESYSGLLSRKERDRFREGDLVVRGGGSAGSNLCSVFHPTKWVRERLARGFTVVDFLPEGAKGNPTQDLYVLQKR